MFQLGGVTAHTAIVSMNVTKEWIHSIAANHVGTTPEFKEAIQIKSAASPGAMFQNVLTVSATVCKIVSN